jgi:hypothetical protein
LIQRLDQWELSIWRKPCHNHYYAIRTSAVSSMMIQLLLYYCVPNLQYVDWWMKYTPLTFWTHFILLVVDKIVYATIVICRLATREIFRTLASLRPCFNAHLTRGETACVIESLHKLLFWGYIDAMFQVDKRLIILYLFIT